MCVINGSGVSFGQVANLLAFIPHHMTTSPVYMCLYFQVSYICIPLNMTSGSRPTDHGHF